MTAGMYLQVTDCCSSKSLGLLAVAAGVIPNAQQMDIVRMSQQQMIRELLVLNPQVLSCMCR